MFYKLVPKNFPSVNFLRPLNEEELSYWINHAINNFEQKRKNNLYSLVYSVDQYLIDELIDKINNEEDFWNHFELQRMEWVTVNPSIIKTLFK